MIDKHERIFKDSVISYIYNRMKIEEKDSVIAEEIMSRFPVWIGFTGSNKADQKQLIAFLVYGMRQVERMKGNEDGSESV